MINKDFNKIPATACTLVVGEFELGENGENAKSAPMRLVARSGKAIEHPFWGRIVHDLSGMKMHKPRLPIDYVHDSKEVIGYLNKFDISTGDLVVSGALVPFKDNDRATEVLFKSKAGVPYEASINFAGDGIKIEEIPDGFVTQVNGYELEGPAVVVREWPLRGVAVCPYGADMNTASHIFAGSKNYSATVIETKPETKKKEKLEMSDTLVKLNEKVETQESTEIEVAENPVEVEATEAAKAVEAVEAEGDVEVVEQPAEEPEAEPVTEETKAELSRSEFLAMVDEFGADIATEIVRQGGDYVMALKLALTKTQDENKQLQEQVQNLSQGKVGTAAPVVDSKPKKTLRTLCEQGASSQRK